jgi:mono/diheme cytochrome c family protein/glucose/arabinose dehydrogenase
MSVLPLSLSQMRVVCLLFLTLIFSASLLAQRGDKRGEEQKPLPEHIQVPPAPVRTPDEEAATFKLAPGFRAELVAADPLVGDPIAMQFGPDGRLWVLEMRGYMPNADGVGEREPVGQVAVLTDTDKDGRYDKRVVFADNLVMARALSLVGDGLLIGEPPHLWFLRDTNGDGVSDNKTEVASDYGNTNNPEHNANGLMWAMDNWIYSANYTWRFRWQGDGKFAREATVTRGQWGITQDDVGRIFYNSNSDPLRHDAMPTAYLKRNPAFNATGSNMHLAGVPADLRIWPGRVTPGVNRGYKILNEEGKITSMTAASGPVIYRGTLLPAEFYGDAFVPEPSANLIKRIKVKEQDGVLAGTNAYQGTEFMTSTDERFRPVNLYNGPDGALYVVDLYRGILQHRIYMTTFLRQQVEERGLDKGIGLGRIWRIVPDAAPKATFDVGLARASVAELVTKLGDSNGWVRDTAQRLLAEKRDGSATSHLRAAALNAAKPPLARLHALWALEGAGGLDRATVSSALSDKDPRVAAAAVRLSENFLRASPEAEAEKLITQLADLVHSRTEPEVRLQLALTLGDARTEAAELALRDLVIEAGRQPLLADAVVSGLGGRENSFVELLLRSSKSAVRAGEVLRYAVSAILKSGDAARIDRVMGIIGADMTPDWARIPMLAGIRHFLPKSPEGRPFPGNLPAEPKALVALAQTNEAIAPIAKQLLAQLKWPGKPGAAETAAKPLSAEQKILFEKGKAQFAALCAACHQPNGQGLAGLAPSLVYSRWVLGDPRILARIVLNGKVQENMVMPPWKAALDDENIAAVLTFVRRSWGHEADPVSPEIVAEARKLTASRDEPFSDADLEEVAQSLSPGKQ